MDDLKQRLNDLAYGTGSRSPTDAITRIEQLERAWKDLEKLSIKLLNEKLQGEWREPLENDLADAEAKLAKAVEALRNLIQHIHNCEKELTEKLHHQDFCGESLPLTNARTVLAELEGMK